MEEAPLRCMTSSGRRSDLSPDEVFTTFTRSDDPHAPRTTNDVVTELDYSRDAVVDTLELLVENDELRSMQVEAGIHLWWLPPTTESERGETSVPRGEHVLELEFRSEGMAQVPRGETTGDGATMDDVDDEFQVTVDGDVALPDGRRIQYYTATGIPVQALLELLEQFAGVVDVRPLSISGDSCRVETELSTDSMSAVFGKYGGRLKTGVYRRGTHRVVGELPDDVDVEAVVAEVRAIYPDLESHLTRRVVTSRQFYRIAENVLTDRQFTVLQLAYYGGYFDQPRESTGSELADRLGITKQTFNTHLQKAYQALFEQLFQDVELTDADWSV